MNNNNREVHPLVDGIFPPLPAEAAAELAADIVKHGQHEPIVLFEKKIIDGKNRHDACLTMKIEPRTISYETMQEFRDGLHPVDFAMSANFFRRDLTTSQRATAKVEAAKRRELPVSSYEELRQRSSQEYEKRQHEDSAKAVEKVIPSHEGMTRKRGKPPRRMKESAQQMAKEAGVSEATMLRAIEIAQRAPKELEAIKRGEKTVFEVFKKLPPTKKQKEARKKQQKKMSAGLTRRDTIQALIERAKRNGGQLYVEIEGFGIRCAKICRVE